MRSLRPGAGVSVSLGRIVRLALAGANYLAAWCLYRVTPRPWQIGGMWLTYELSLLFLLLGTAFVVLSFPRRRRLPAGVLVAVLVAAFVILWPNWEAHVFPDTVGPEDLIAQLTSTGVEPSSILLYTTAREREVTPQGELAEPVPEGTKVVGFRCADTDFRALWFMLSRGWNVYPCARGG